MLKTSHLCLASLVALLLISAKSFSIDNQSQTHRILNKQPLTELVRESADAGSGAFLAKTLDGSTSVNVERDGSVSKTNVRIGGYRPEPFYIEDVIECPSYLDFYTDEVYSGTTSTYVDFTVNASSTAPLGPAVIKVEYTFHTGSGTGVTYLLTINVTVYDPSYPKPTVDFTGTPAKGIAPLTVQFMSQTTGTIYTYLWNFGDGTTSNLANPSHTYPNPGGSYSVSLVVSGPGGSTSISKGGYIDTAPVADFSATPTSGMAPLTVQFTSQFTGSVSGVLWNFGDGGTSTATNPSHVYATAGTWTVTLSVTGFGGTTSTTKSNYITSQSEAPTVDFTGTPTTGTAPLSVQFSSQTTGTISSYAWDFGNGGSSNSANPKHTYSNAGSWNVKLTVTGPGGSTSKNKNAYIITTAPSATVDFTATPQSGTIPLLVQFTSQTTGTISAYLWDFGDGSTSTEANPQHTYLSAGNFTVKLTVTTSGTPLIKTKNSLIVTTEPAPTVDFTAIPTLGDIPLLVQFTSHTTGAIITYLWDFGDGGTSSLANPQHVFATAGSWTIKLTVTGPGGTSSEIKNNYIQGNNPPPLIATNEWVNFYGSNSSHQMDPLPVGARIRAFDPQGILCGECTVNTAGHYGFLPVYRDDITTPDIDEGAVPGDTIHFELDGVPLKVGLGIPVWTVNGAVIHLEFMSNFPPQVLHSLQDIAVDEDVLDYPIADGDTVFNDAENDPLTLTVASIIPEVKALIGSDHLIRVTPESNWNGFCNIILTASDGHSQAHDTVGVTVRPVNDTPIVAHPTADYVCPWNSNPGVAADLDTVFQDPDGDALAFFTQGNNPRLVAIINQNHEVVITFESKWSGQGEIVLVASDGSLTVRDTLWVVALDPEPAVAQFTAHNSSGIPPLAVQFQNQSSGSITGRAWDFGDGANSNEENPLHLYTLPGEYSVTLKVIGPLGENQITKTNYIHVLNSKWLQLSSQVTDDIYAVQWLDSLNAYAIGGPAVIVENKILRTMDGGKSWSSSWIAGVNHLRDLVFISKELGWIVADDGSVFKYNAFSGGWDRQFSPAGFRNRAIHFVDKLNGFIAATDGNLLTTNDGGGFWKQRNIGQKVNLNDIFFIDDKTGWAVGETGKVFKSTTSGKYWDEKATGVTDPLYFVMFQSSQNGWAAGGTNSPKHAVILRTQNGGDSWQRIFEDTVDPIHALCFANGDSAWAVGENGLLLNSQNGGNTWLPENSGSTANLFDVDFIANRYGLIGGSAGTLLKRNLIVQSSTAVLDHSETKPENVAILPNYPNPFNSSTRVSIELRDDENINIAIYNTVGQKVAELFSGFLTRGRHDFIWNGFDRAGLQSQSGIYLCRVSFKNEIKVIKMTLIH